MSERDQPGAMPNPFARIAAEQMALLGKAPEETAEQRQKREEDARHAHNRQWLEAALEVARLRAVRFIVENPESTGLALEAVRNWQQAPAAPHLLLRGTTGTGKTVAAAWLVRHCTEPRAIRPSIVWLYPDEVVSAVMHRYDDRAPKLGRYVVIDELGTETRPEFTVALSRLLDRDHCSVLMTTNLGRAAFQERYGKDDRFTSRAGGAVEIADIAGKDRRRRINNG